MIDALCDRGHTPYRQIGERAVSYVMDRCGIRYTPDEARWLVSEIEKLKPFPDVRPALEQLRSKGYKLAILSNGDRDMLEAARPHIGFAFDHVISVEQAGYFKPHWKTYAKAAEILGEERSDILFVANPTQAAVRPHAASARSHRGRFCRTRRGAGLKSDPLVKARVLGRTSLPALILRDART